MLRGRQTVAVARGGQCLMCDRAIGSPAREPSPCHIIGMSRRKPHSPDRKVIAKAERRLAKADKQRAGIKADPKAEVARVRTRIKKDKPDA
jgi:hypothetical protein